MGLFWCYDGAKWGRALGASKGACGVPRLGRPTHLGRRAGPWAMESHEALTVPLAARKPTPVQHQRNFFRMIGRPCGGHTGVIATTKHPTATLGCPRLTK